MLAVGSLSAQAGVVTVWGETLSGFSQSSINNFYNGLAGHSSSIATGTLDTVDLSNTDLLWATQPADSYSAAEIAAMSAFLSGGGRIAFMGEHGTFGAAQNNFINAALTSLGANISINNLLHDSGFRTASVADGQILAHSLTAGVSTYQYAAYAPLTIGGAAQALMIGENQPSIMMAYQNVGGGSIFLITDQNVWDNAPTWGGSFNNGRMFENLLVGDVTNNVPEPAGLALAAFALMACFGATRRRKQ